MGSHSEKVPSPRREAAILCPHTALEDHQPSLCWKVFALQGEQSVPHPSTRHSLCSIRRALAEAARLSKPRAIGLQAGGLGTGAPAAAGVPGVFLWAEQTSQAPQPPSGLCGARRRRTVSAAGFSSEKSYFPVSRRGLRSGHVTGRPLKVGESYRFHRCALHHVQTE